MLFFYVLEDLPMVVGHYAKSSLQPLLLCHDLMNFLVIWSSLLKGLIVPKDYRILITSPSWDQECCLFEFDVSLVRKIVIHKTFGPFSKDRLRKGTFLSTNKQERLNVQILNSSEMSTLEIHRDQERESCSSWYIPDVLSSLLVSIFATMNVINAFGLLIKLLNHTLSTIERKKTLQK